MLYNYIKWYIDASELEYKLDYQTDEELIKPMFYSSRVSGDFAFINIIGHLMLAALTFLMWPITLFIITVILPSTLFIRRLRSRTIERRKIIKELKS